MALRKSSSYNKSHSSKSLNQSMHLSGSKNLFSEHDNIVIEGTSLYLFDDDSRIRRFLKKVLSKNNIFEIIVYLLILTQAVLIAFD